jgi:hypothetical protein
MHNESPQSPTPPRAAQATMDESTNFTLLPSISLSGRLVIFQDMVPYEYHSMQLIQSQLNQTQG